MKVNAFVTIVFREFRQMRNQLVYIALVAVSLLTITMCLLTLSLRGTPQIESLVDKQWHNLIRINYSRVPFQEVQQLADYGLINIRCAPIKEDAIIFEIDSSLPDDCSMQFYFFQDQLVNYFGNQSEVEASIFFRNGRPWSFQDTFQDNNGEYSIWISDIAEADYGLQVGDSYLVHGKSNDIKVSIQGVFDSKLSEEMGIYASILLPFEIGEIVATESGQSFLLNGEGTLNAVSRYSDLLNFANTHDFVLSGIGTVEDLIKGVAIVRNVCAILSLLLVVCAITALSNLMTMSLSGRSLYIALQKALGSTSTKLAIVYGTVLETIVFIAVFFAHFIANALCRRMSERFLELLDIQAILKITFSDSLTAFLFASIIVLLMISKFLKKTGEVTIIEFLKE